LAIVKVTDADLAGRAGDTFRAYGYEGASLNRLAEAMGLEKASLYYRFPGGKDAILMAAVERVGAWFEANVFEPLRQPSPLADRVEAAVTRLREFYADGTKPCVLDTLSLRGGTPELQSALQTALAEWLKAFAAVAVEAGFPYQEAQQRAEQAVIAIEGSLVLARVTGKSEVFLSATAELRSRLLGP
jgi:AcrR family transcriptional regulator